MSEDRTKELVSIVIPAYNRGFCIANTIQSCVEQDYESIEILVVDDHSTDDTEKVVKAMMGHISCLRYYKGRDGEKGAQHARMRGVQEAKGAYICFLDSDDTLTHNSISIRMKCFDNDPDACFVYGNNAFVNLNSMTTEEVKKFLLHEMCLCTFSVMLIKKVMFDEGRIAMDLTLPAWQDDDLVMSVAFSGGKMVHCNEEVAVIVPSPNSISRNQKKRLIGIKKMYARYKKDIYKEYGLSRLFLWRIRILRDRLLVILQYMDNKNITLGKEAIYKIYRKIHVFSKKHFYKICG